MIQTKITCDECNADLTEGDSMPKYRLHLSAQKLPNNTGIMKAVHVRPSVDGEKTFCNKKCLRNWLEGN